MAFKRRSSSAWSDLSTFKRRSSGAWAQVQNAYRRLGTTWVAVWTSFTTTLSSSLVGQTVNPQMGVITYNGSITSTPSGGTSPFTYSWTRVAGSTPTTFSNTTAQTASWTFLDGAGLGGTITFQCVTTDATGLQSVKQITVPFG